jgi:tol-pal system-associated acyl-CoA thioesterase
MPFSITVRVYYEDTDAGGVVYHANYLRFLERCRSDWLAHHGWPVDRVQSEWGVVFVVTAIEAKFLAPARLMDEVWVSTEIVETRRVQCKARQTVRRGDELLFEAMVSLACVRVSTLRPCAIPEPLKPFFEVNP